MSTKKQIAEARAELPSPMLSGEVQHTVRIYNHDGELLLWEATGATAIPVPNVGEYANVSNDRGEGAHWTVKRREFIYTPLRAIVDLYCSPRKA